MITSPRDLQMIIHPEQWPKWPFLPLKRTKNNDLETGFLVDASGATNRVFLGNIFTCIDKRTDISTLDTREYESPEELLMDGWEVD